MRFQAHEGIAVMNILVIGGTGFISSALVQRLLDAGHSVTIFNRGRRALPFIGAERLEVIRGDRSVKGAFERQLRGRVFDAVYDMIAYSGAESEVAASFFHGKTGRFIHCSTVSVYMVSTDVRCPITEDQARAPLMEYWPGNPFGMEYGISKRKCEEVLWNAHDEKLLPVTVLRPTFVSGPGDPTRRDYFWMQRIADGGPLLIPGTGEYRFQQVFIRDVALAFASVLDHRDSIGHAYNVAGEEEFSLLEYLRTLASMMGKNPVIVSVPQEQFDQLSFSSNPAGDVFPFNTRCTAIFSLDAIQRDLEYRSTPFRQWMAKTILWWTELERGPSMGYDRRAEEIQCAEKWMKSVEDQRIQTLNG